MLVQEKKRQKHFINLIPSENFTSQAVLDALGSVMQSSYSAPARDGSSKLTLVVQINTPRDILGLATMEGINTSTKPNGYVNSVLWRRTVWIRRNGGSMCRVSFGPEPV